MAATLKRGGAMIEERGTPRELAARMACLPDGQYRVFVQPVRSCEETSAVLDRIARDIRDNLDAEVTGKSDDQVMDMVNAIIDEEREKERTRRHA